MKITKSRLKEIIKEEVQKFQLKEARGRQDWPTLQKLVGETQTTISNPWPKVNLAEMDFLEILQGLASGAASSSWMASDYDMESDDFPQDLFENYSDELMQLQADSGEESYDLTPERMQELISEHYWDAYDAQEEHEREQHYEQEYDLSREP